MGFYSSCLSAEAANPLRRSKRGVGSQKAAHDAGWSRIRPRGAARAAEQPVCAASLAHAKCQRLLRKGTFLLFSLINIAGPGLRSHSPTEHLHQQNNPSVPQFPHAWKSHHTKLGAIRFVTDSNTEFFSFSWEGVPLHTPPEGEIKGHRRECLYVRTPKPRCS